jgi:CMP/dCMP kinase
MNHVDFSQYVPEVITLDGPSAVGKGTLCRLLKETHLAESLDQDRICILDAGLTYRMLTYYFQNIDVKSPEILNHMGPDLPSFLQQNVFFGYNNDGFTLNGEAIDTNLLKTPMINEWIASYAGLDAVKLHVVESQRRFVEESRDHWWLLDGRCMGTAVAPYAIAKVFVDADSGIKAGWRYHEYRDRGVTDRSSQQVLEELRMRDKLDWSANVHPLAIPYGSFFVWAHMGTPEQNAQAIYDFVSARLLREGRTTK